MGTKVPFIVVIDVTVLQRMANRAGWKCRLCRKWICGCVQMLHQSYSWD